MAESATDPRTDSATGAKSSSTRPNLSSFNNMGGIAKISATAAVDAHPATSYSGEGAAKRLAISATTTSAGDNRERLRSGSWASTIPARPNRDSTWATTSNGPTSRRTPTMGGSNRAKAPARASSCPDTLSSSSRPRLATTR